MVQATRVPLKTLILVVWCLKLVSAILKYVKYSAVLENGFPASQQRLEVLRGTHSTNKQANRTG